MEEKRSWLRSTVVMTGALAISAAFTAPAAFAQQTLPYSHEDTEGFVSIFDGSTLNGWQGDSRYWRVEDGVIVGETSADNPLEQNTFLIYQRDSDEGRFRDFELKLEFRLIGAGNSGVQVRSSVAPDASHEWRLTGYQVDMDFANRYTGMTYGEGAGGFLAPRGTVSHIMPGRERPQTVATLGSDLELKGLMNTNGWNTLHIIFRGNTLINILNGRITSVVIDDDPASANRLAEGWIGLQAHTGPPMRVEFRNIYVKNLD